MSSNFIVDMYAYHRIGYSVKKIMSYKKSMITAILALLLIGSTITLSTFQKARAQKTLPPLHTPLQSGQQTAPSNPPKTKGQQAFPNIPPPNNANQGQQQQQSNHGQGEEHRQQGGKAKGKNKHNVEEDFVPIATSGNNNVYLAWPSNKTTSDFEIMFKASTDNGKTFSPKINLSNSTGIDSERPQIAAAGNNVYVTWWERANLTSNEPVMRVSNDNGKTFGEKIMLSAK
jgi:hypothetical protein